MEDAVEWTPFRVFTRESLFSIERRIAEEQAAKEADKVAHDSSSDDDEDVEEPAHEQEPKPNPKLEAGRKLPPSLEDVPSEYIGRPLEDLDEFYHNQKTFVVLSKDKSIFRFSATNAMFILTPFNPFRRIAIYILVHPLFSVLVMLTILVNCIFMTITSWTVPTWVEHVFLGIYTMEAIVKLLARGFILEKFTFLRDPWNWLDFVVICSAYLTMAIKQLQGLTALRTFRVLRALKTVAVIPGLKTIVGALLEAVRRLRDVMILTVFMLSIFALIGMQLYTGSLRHKCIRNWTEVLGPDVTHDQWYEFVSDPVNWELDNFGEYQVCGNSTNAGHCGMTNKTEGSYVCIPDIGPNPNYDFTSFDNFFWALLCAFRLMTQDFWESFYHLILRANGQPYALYFGLVIMLGAFYLVNLILAIVAMSYDETQKQDAVDAEEEAAERLQQDAEKLSMQTRSPTIASDEYETGAHERDSIASDASGNLKPDSQNRASLSLPGSPFIKRTGSRGSTQFTWKPKGHPHLQHLHDRQPLVHHHHNPEALPLPFADDSAAVTPSSEDLCNSPFLTRNMPNGRRFSFANLSMYRHPLAVGRPASRRGSNASRESRASRASRQSIRSRDAFGGGGGGGAGEGLSKMETLLNKAAKGSKAPDVVLDTSGLDDAVSFTSIEGPPGEKIKMSPSNSFLNASPTGQNVEMKDVMVLKDILDQATENRQSFLSVVSQPQGTLKNKLYKYCCVWDCWPWFTWLQGYIRLFIMDAFVDLFITLSILVNTLFMALDQHNMNEDLKVVANQANYVFTGIFAAEAFFKVLAMSAARYFKDGWNIFDFIIVALSLMELGFIDLPGVTVLRAFRLLRVFKLAKSWSTLNMLISIVARTVSAIGNLVIVLWIVVFIFAVMGQQLFGDDYLRFQNITEFPDMKGQIPRWNFRDFLHSFMIVFRVLCGEWIQSMWNCMRVSRWPCVPFFLLTMIVGNLVVLNLFLALLLSSFGAESLQKSETEEEPNKLAEAFDRFRRLGSWMKVKIIVCLKMRLKSGKGKQLSAPMQVSPELNGKEALTDGVTANGLEKTPDDVPDGAKVSLSRASSVSSHKKPAKSPTGSELTSSSSSLTSDQGMGRVEGEGEPEINEVEVVYKKEPDDCLCKICMMRPFVQNFAKSDMGKAWWSFRCFMYRVTEHKYFESFIIFMIVVSSGALAFEDANLPERPLLGKVLEYMDYCFTVIFLVEMLIKWLAFGYKTYFSDAWCWLDFMIVSLSIFLLAMKNVNVGAIKSLRTLRALRPLRAVSRWEGMRVVVNALIKAIPSICNVMVVCLVFWLIFGIMGVQLFNGTFYSCRYENNTRVPITEVDTEEDCKNKSYKWVNAKVNFDNVIMAYLALFQVATYKGWTDIMDDAIDNRGKGFQPDKEANTYYYLYFVVFIILGSFFTLNLFIGVIIENFNQQKKKAGGSLEMFMTEDQKRYYQAMKKMSSKAPQKSIPKPKLKIAALIFDITTNQRFDIVIMIIIMLNMVTMTLEFYGMPEEMKHVLMIVNFVFIAIFTLECVLKLIGLRLYYFKIPWNVFDFAVVVLSILASSLSEFESFFISPTLLRVIRVFRVGRVLRLVKSAKGIRTLLFSLAVSLPALFNIGLLLVLIMFIYAIMGMSFFMEYPREAGLDDIFNFDTFISSFILLFQMCTSAGWSDVMNGLIAACPESGPCSEYMGATIYLSTYLIISYLVVVNMYIAVILENFSQATEDVQQGLMPEDFDMYYEKWERYDPKATKYIPLDQLSDFVDYLDEPLRLPKPNHFLLVKMEIPICEDDKCFCRDILDALTKNYLGTSDTSAVPVKKDDCKDENYMAISNTLKRQKEHYAARIIQKAYRNYKKRKDEEDEEEEEEGVAGRGAGRGSSETDKEKSSDASGPSVSGDTTSTVHPSDDPYDDHHAVVTVEVDVDSRSVELKADSDVVA